MLVVRFTIYIYIYIYNIYTVYKSFNILVIHQEIKEIGGFH